MGIILIRIVVDSMRYCSCPEGDDLHLFVGGLHFFFLKKMKILMMIFDVKSCPNFKETHYS